MPCLASRGSRGPFFEHVDHWLPLDLRASDEPSSPAASCAQKRRRNLAGSLGKARDAVPREASHGLTTLAPRNR